MSKNNKNITPQAASVNMEHEHEKLVALPIEKNNLKQTLFILAKSFVASGVLFLPKAYVIFIYNIF